MRAQKAGRIAVLAHLGRPAARRAAADLRARLTRQGREVRIEEHMARDLGVPGHSLPALASWCDVLISLGGDGTALTAGRALAGKQGTLLPINLGGLGFLCVAEARELKDAVRLALAGKWPVEERRILRASVTRGKRVVSRGFGMNDAVIKGAGGAAAVHLRLAALGHDLGHLVADGLIVASAAGSTAYSLSAGGPVLAPDLEALVVTPVCAHSLGSRSLVLDGDSELAVRVIGSFDRVLLLLDGQSRFELEPKDEVRARLDRAAVRMFQNPERPFTRALQAKLGWQGSARRSM